VLAERSQEALDLLESRWDDVPLERLLSTAVQIVRVQRKLCSRCSIWQFSPKCLKNSW
jgi:hypothetical protein